MFTFTLFSDLFASDAVEYETTIDGLAEWLRGLPEYPSKGDCPLISAAKYGGARTDKNSLRHDANILEFTGLVGDYDAGVLSPEAGAALLRQAGVSAVIVTTASHGLKGQRWRVIAPISKVATPDEQRTLLGRLNTLLGGVLAPESFTRSQSFYVGRVLGVPYEVIQVPGQSLDALPSISTVAPTMPAPKPPAATSSDWTTEPIEDWSGPEDDAELIRRALSSSSAASAFSDKASFKNLWEADADALAQAYPGGEGEYNASRADMALAQHLAFWTGKNCDRVVSLMKQSALVREKWDREDYIPRTVLRAVSLQLTVAKEKPKIESAVEPTAYGAYVMPSEMSGYFDGCTYVRDVHKVLCPRGFLLKPEQFKVVYGGHKFVLDPEGKATKNAWEAFSEGEMWRPPMADSVCFRPELEPGLVFEHGGVNLVNMWAPVNVPSAPGDASKFFNHLKLMLPDEGDYAQLVAYLASCVQNPGIKFSWAPLIQGVKGNGKSIIITAMTHALSERYTHLPKASDLSNKFNAWIQGKLLIGVEEIRTAARREILDELLDLVTNRRVPIQGKSADQVTGDNRANFVFLSNHKDAIPIDEEERRYSIFYTAQQCLADLAHDGMLGDYFPDLYDWAEGRGKYGNQGPGFAHVTHALQTWPIPAELDPAGAMHRAPETSSTSKALVESLGIVEQEIQEAVAQELAGFAGGWISSVYLDRFLERLKLGRLVPPNKRTEMLRRLGYIPHPGLPGGRATAPVLPDATKPVLFVLEHHLSLNFTTPKEILASYSKAQNVTIDGAVNTA